MSALLLALVLPTAVAAEWRLVNESGDCRFWVDDSQDTYNGRASCLWTDVAAAKVIGALEDPTHAPAFFSNVKESRVLTASGTSMQVFQVHKFPVGNDRETYKNLTSTPLGDGLRIEWAMYDDPPPPADGRVTLEADHGYWQIKKGTAGTEIEFFMAYGPGGFLGVFPANRFMADGMVQTLNELRVEARR